VFSASKHPASPENPAEIPSVKPTGLCPHYSAVFPNSFPDKDGISTPDIETLHTAKNPQIQDFYTIPWHY